MLAIAVALLTGAGVRAFAETSYTPPPADPPPYTNPVAQGDFPDPTAMRVGGDYWAITTASSGRRSPPILHSRDLVHWSYAGNLFTNPPPWSKGTQLWGPWLVRDGDTYRVYYSARKRYGRPCITVGQASAPQGPYDDHGPLVCQSGGSIDPSFTHNANGWPFLVWKQNGGDKPSSLWTQPLSLDGLRMTGPQKKILVGKRNSWEHGLIEGPRIVRRHRWLYLFYSGGGCCSRSNCSYALGVARAHSIYGPWRRAKRNPILKTNEQVVCPGHGAILQTPSGHWWLLYNGYAADAPPGTGRDLMLDLIHWTRDEWPYIVPGSYPRTTTSPGGTASR